VIPPGIFPAARNFARCWEFEVQKDYWVAIALYGVATVLTGLPFFGVVQFDLPLSYSTLKLLHIFFVFAVLSVLIGQLIAFNVMEHTGITTQKALERLSLLDHTIPVSLVAIGVLGHSMVAQLGPLWEVGWAYESSFALLLYTLGGLITTLFFRRTRMNLDEESRNTAGTYLASGFGIVFILFITGIMVFKRAPVPTAFLFEPVTKYFSGA